MKLFEELIQYLEAFNRHRLFNNDNRTFYYIVLNYHENNTIRIYSIDEHYVEVFVDKLYVSDLKNKFQVQPHNMNEKIEFLENNKRDITQKDTNLNIEFCDFWDNENNYLFVDSIPYYKSIEFDLHNNHIQIPIGPFKCSTLKEIIDLIENKKEYNISNISKVEKNVLYDFIHNYKNYELKYHILETNMNRILISMCKLECHIGDDVKTVSLYNKRNSVDVFIPLLFDMPNTTGHVSIEFINTHYKDMVLSTEPYNIYNKCLMNFWESNDNYYKNVNQYNNCYCELFKIVYQNKIMIPFGPYTCNSTEELVHLLNTGEELGYNEYILK